MSDAHEEPSHTQAVPFGRKLAGSEAFRLLFRDGMELIEQTAGYLDGPGRVASRGLARPVALAYARESMRLTTRLMQLASWLLLQRAVNEGEMTRAQAEQETHKVRVQALSGESGDLTGLPDGLLDLIARSLRLQERVQRLDVMLHGETLSQGENVVADHIARLRAVFDRD